ncbi:hypothetical protein EAI_09231 [Harpegnathos saltator]|uniref:Uncharacterized protein n=1 Tax=Harpegnathos saltator TaxID=610380 RepID=E2C1Y6_HARSA|nr:hypothetical protein EAI_09231 [Harpegnathos saltator]
MNTTQEQKEMILQWMKLNPEVARRRLRRKGESRNEMKKLLEDLARTIMQLTLVLSKVVQTG